LTVSRGRVLIIEDDEWISAVLAKVLGDAEYIVDLATEAQAGFEKARELVPDCIICDIVLPDIDGFWVARKVRTEPSMLATTPFLFLTSLDDEESRMQGFNVGADVYITKPFRNDEVVAQVGALIGMADRLREQRDSLMGMPPSSPSSPAIRGDLGQMSLTTVLTLLEMERRSGRFKVRTGGPKTAVLELVEGQLVRALMDDAPADPVTVLRTTLAWRTGRFWFRPEPVASSENAGRQSIGALMLEVLRLEDEARR
jgi:two-component system, OmpR family, response regulator